MHKKTIIYDNKNFHSILDTIESYSKSKEQKIWTPPTISLLKQFDIQSGNGSGNEGSNLGIFQSGLGS